MTTRPPPQWPRVLSFDPCILSVTLLRTIFSIFRRNQPTMAQMVLLLNAFEDRFW